MWDLSDDGWRKVLRVHLNELQEQRNRRLNTPKSRQIDELFLAAMGAVKVSNSWKWPNMTPTQARNKLDKYVTLRSEIAHRGTASRSCKKAEVDDYFSFILRLAGETGGRVNVLVRNATGKQLF